MKKKRAVFIAFQIVVAIMVFSVAAILLLSHFGYINVVKPYIVQSGSMEPVVKVGSVVFAAPSKTYGPGEIISFAAGGDKKKIVTHRIVFKLYPDGPQGAPVYLTSGDANEEFDRWEVTDEHIVGKVFLTVPYAGYLADFAKKPQGFILFVIIPATIIIYEELRFLKGQLQEKLLKRRTIKEASEAKGLPKTSVFIPLFGAALVLAGVSSSFFSDIEKSTGNLFTAGVWSPPVADHIVISEVQIDGGVGQANKNDFIELYNPTNSSKNLNGHRLVLRTGSSTNDTNIFTFSSSHVIPAHGFFLWAHKSQNNNFADTISADVFSADELGASNSVALRQGDLDTGTIIDALSWNESVNSLKEGTHFSPNPGINQSMERKAYSASTQATMEGGADSLKGNGFDGNNNSTDFILRTTSQPQNSSSPTETP